VEAYPDASFLVSVYLTDAHSSDADRLMFEFRSSLALTPLHELEFSNAVELAVFRRVITAPQAIEARADLEQDVAHWNLQPLPVDTFARAVTLARRHTARRGTLSLDILHVAAALALGAEAFLTFDHRRHWLAKAEGLRPFPK
jgi:predicted nucleic acid-binding protein